MLIKVEVQGDGSVRPLLGPAEKSSRGSLGTFKPKPKGSGV